MKKLIYFIFFILIASAMLIFYFNYFGLSKPLAETIESDSRNSGINIKAHYGNYIFPSVLVIDIREVSKKKSAADVFRLLLQYSSIIKEKKFETVELSSKGKTKFFLKGAYFQQLGIEYENQNPVYTIRTFPENVYLPDGANAFSKWTGGFLGVLGKQMEDFNEFNRQWYIEDIDK